jgi:hypothetical protein
MSFLKKPFRRLTGKTSGSNVNDPQNKSEGFDSPKNGSTSSKNGDVTPNGTSTPPEARRKSREILREEKVRKSVDKERSKNEAKKRQSMRRIESEAFMRDAPEELTKLYRPYSMNMSKKWNHEKRLLFKDMDFQSMSIYPSAARYPMLINGLELEGTVVSFRARIHTLRRMSAKMVFIVFRQQTITIQGVLASFKQKGEAEGKRHLPCCLLILIQF